MLDELVTKCRSYRRFSQKKISRDTLVALVELARKSACGGNKQSLKFFLSADSELNAKIFPSTIWAGALTNWSGPAQGERPVAYIIILQDKNIANSSGVDYGIAAQSMVLGAMEKGIGACMIGSIKRDQLALALEVPDKFSLLLIIALGYPGEEVVLEDFSGEGCIDYYRDENSVHYVPKRKLEDLIVEF